MRQGPNTRRSRGRGNSGRRNNVPLRHQTFDSNGPDVRIRGNAHQIYEKYLALARDASSSGDRIQAENYYQHAEHYFRIVNAIQEQENARRQTQQRAESSGQGGQTAGANGHQVNGHDADGGQGDDSDWDDGYDDQTLNA